MAGPDTGYELKGVPLDGGLDTLSPISYAVEGGASEGKQGSLVDCLNYEIVDKAGYARIQGITPFDGGVDAFNDDVYFVYSATRDGAGTYTTGNYLYAYSGTTQLYDRPFGMIVDSYDNGAGSLPKRYVIFYLRLDKTAEPTAGQKALVLGGTGLASCIEAPRPARSADSTFTNIPQAMSAYVPWRNNQTAAASVLKQTLNAQVSGLKWFKDSLYAVADYMVLEYNSGGTTQVFPGDQLQYAGTYSGYSTFYFDVIDVTLTSGTWGAGTAAGLFLVRSQIRRESTINPAYSPQGSYLKYPGTSFSATNVDLIKTDTSLTLNVATITSITNTTDPWKAGLWRARSEKATLDEGFGISTVGWNPVDLGWLVEFNNGTSEVGFWNKIARNVRTQEVSTPTATITDFYTPGTILTYLDFPGSNRESIRRWTASTGFDSLTYGGGSETDLNASVVQATGDQLAAQVNVLRFSSDPSLYSATQAIGFFDFSALEAEIPKNAVINGIEVTLLMHNSGDCFPAGTVNYQKVKCYLLKTSSIADGDPFGTNRTEQVIGGVKEKAMPLSDGVPGDDGIASFGGDNDLWGNAKIDRETLISPNFGFAVALEWQLKNKLDASFYYRIDLARIRVTYTPASIKYFFTDNVAAPTNTVSGYMIDYDIESGSLKGGNATGVMQISNLQATTGTRAVIKSGWTMHTALPVSTANQVATITANMAYNGLESASQLRDEGTRYEFIAANFFADEEYEGLYGCSGAGRAFAFDGTYLSRIYAIPLKEDEADEKDKPRHIAFHHGHLCLGYKSGVVLISRPGEPEDFDTVNGAGLVATGDTITGLTSLAGTTLGIFCRNSIWSMSGTSVADLTTQIISPRSGCIEYTLQDIGNMPIFCDEKGISTLEQSEKYGDFLGSRLSYRVSEWLLPRLTREPNLYDGSIGAGIYCATTSKKKNQYHLWFSDGLVLTMSLVGPEREPQFTRRRYCAPRADYNALIYSNLSNINQSWACVPFAACDDSTQTGEARSFVAFDHSKLGTAAGNTTPYMVYELDRGWGFGASDFDHFFEVGYLFLGNPFNSKTIGKVRLHGLSKGYAPLEMMVDKDFIKETVYVRTNRTVNCSLPIPSTTIVQSVDYVPYSSMAYLKGTGDNFLIRIQGANFGNDLSSGTGTDASPPHICQLLLIQYEEGKADG